MSLSTFELWCLPIVVLTLASLAWVRRIEGASLGRLAIEYVSLCVAGYLGEETCIAWYDYYHYANGWHAKLDHVPVLIVLIWPLFILSGRDMGKLFFPSMRSWLSTSLIVLFDASLVEVVAVRAGYWSWAEPGHLGVPLIGILGWSCFAVGAAWGLELAPSGSWWKLPLRVMVASFVSTHVLLVVFWWGLFRHTNRQDLGASGFVPLVALAAFGLLRSLREGPSSERSRPSALMRVVFPRLAATALFLTIASKAVTSLRDRISSHILLVAGAYIAASMVYLARDAWVKGTR